MREAGERAGGPGRDLDKVHGAGMVPGARRGKEWRVPAVCSGVVPGEEEKEVMKVEHLGDITKISGYEAPAVDVVIGGSPC